MNKKSAKQSNPPITAEVRPITLQAIHAGIKVLRYFSDPISRNKLADPINEITRADRMLTIMPEIRSLWRRFLRETSISCIFSLRAVFISVSIASIISLTVGNYSFTLSPII
jgi:hypothetical protein